MFGECTLATRWCCAILAASMLLPCLPAQVVPAATAEVVWDGDTTVSDERDYKGNVITLTGNLTITGTLTIDGTELLVDCPGSGTRWIAVESGGSFNVLNGSAIHSSDPLCHFGFRVEPGGALYMNASELHDCGWGDHYSEDLRQLGLHLDSSAVRITNSTITRNNSGIVVANGTAPYIYHNNISYNDACGVEALSGSAPVIDANRICHNMVWTGDEYTLGSVYSEGSSPVITNNTIADTVAGAWCWGSHGITLCSGGSPIILDNNISGHYNEGTDYPSGIEVWNCDPVISGNDIWGNNWGIVLGSGQATVTGNRIHDNKAMTYGDTDGAGVKDSSASCYANNTYYGNCWAVCLAESSSSSFESESICSSKMGGVGEYCWGIPYQVVMRNCSFSKNTDDVLLQDPIGISSGGSLELVDPVWNQPRVQVTDPYATFRLEWTVGARVLMESDRRPVDDARVDFTDACGLKACSLRTDREGRTEPVLLVQYVIANCAPMKRAPYVISASNALWSNSTRAPVDSTANYTILFDDVPTLLEILSPANGSLTNRTEVRVRGVTEPDVSLTFDGGQVYVLPDGSWSQDMPLDLEGANTAEISAVGHSHVPASRTLTVNRDTVPPALNVTSPKPRFLTNLTSIEVAGRTEAGARIDLNGERVQVDSSGGFRTAVNLSEGQNLIRVESHDAAGNLAAVEIAGSSDTIPPVLRLVGPPDGYLTADGNCVIRGSVERGCDLTLNGRALATEGDFAVEVDLLEGQNVFRFVARDRAGNGNSAVVTIVRDSTPPGLVISYPSDGLLLNRSYVELRGSLDGEATLVVNGEAVEHPFGNFSLTLSLAEGKNTITVEARDALGNSVSVTLNVTVDTIAPRLKLLAPADGTLTNRTAVNVTGTAEAGAAVSVNGAAATVDRSGAFFCIAELAVEGPNELAVTARDTAGNEVMRTVTVLRDTELWFNITSPRNGDRLKAGKVRVAGNAEPGATVRVGSAACALRPDGAFSFEVPLAFGENRINITISDRAGNADTVRVLVVRERQAPANGFIPGFDAVALAVAALASMGLAGKRRCEGGRRG